MARIGWKTQESVPVAVAIERLSLSMPKSEKQLPEVLSVVTSTRKLVGVFKFGGESETCKRSDDVKSDEIPA